MSSPKNPYNPGEPDGSMQRRTLLAFVLMGLVLFGMPYLFKSAAPTQPVKDAKKTERPRPDQVAPATPAAKLPAAAPAAATSSAATPVSGATKAAHDEEQFVVETATYHVVFSNRGAVVKSWTLRKYPDAAGKPLEVVNAAAAAKIWYPFSVEFRGQKPPVNLNQALFVATQAPNGLGITFDYTNNGMSARKTFEFQRDGYLTQITSEVKQSGVALPHLLAWRGGFGDFAVQNAAAMQHSIHYDLDRSKLVNEGPKEAKEGPVNRDGQFSFAGLEDQYFAAVFLPSGNGPLQTTLFQDYVPTALDKSEQPFIGSAAGGEAANSLSFFVGPKDVEMLRKINPKLEQIVDFGTFSILAKPLFEAIKFLNLRYVHNYGWSIVIVTVFINFLLFPLRLVNMRSMKKMQKLQPQIQAINEKYKGLSLRDPKMAQKNEETMALYKANGANPMAGCLPLLIQMPFLFAFYKVLSVSIEMRNASWLWVTDLSQPEHLGLRLLPLLMIGTGFIMQRMTPATGMDPSQQRMMMFMPLIMGFFFYGQSSGLVLYWLTGNLMGIAQQYFFNKTMTPAEAAPVPAVIAGSKNPQVKKPVRK